jgi:hypothetical protein
LQGLKFVCRALGLCAGSHRCVGAKRWW